MYRIVLPIILGLSVSGPAVGNDMGKMLSNAAIERTGHHVIYDGRYQSISYPGGDISDDTGVCSDVVIRTYRTIGIDLQVLVHEDMKQSFSAYPTHWKLSKPDTNIDHRRVPNLQVFFTRHGQSLPKSTEASAYLPGDLVTWMLPGNRPHIGVVTDKMVTGTHTPMLVHNAGLGPKLEDVLFAWPMTGHYRFRPTLVD